MQSSRAEIEARYDPILLRGKVEWHQPPDPGQPVKRVGKRRAKWKIWPNDSSFIKKGFFGFFEMDSFV